MLCLLATSLLVNLSPWFVDANLYSINKTISRKMMGFPILYHCKDYYRTWRYVWATRRVSYKKQEPLTLREPLIMCLYVLSSVVWCLLRFLHKTMLFLILYVLVGGLISYLRYLYLLAYSVVVFYTYCLVFLLCFSSSCVPYVASFSGLSIFDGPFGIL